MTEAEFLASEDPVAMLKALQSQSRLRSEDEPSARKLRLFACACCRNVWHLLTDERSRKAVEVAERFADGEATEEERLLAYREATGVAGVFIEPDAPWLAYGTCGLADAADAACSVSRAHTLLFPDQAIARRIQATLLRDIVGNPFRPVTLRWELTHPGRWPHDSWSGDDVPEMKRLGAVTCPWLTETVLGLAQHIYEARDFEAMPVLGDALEEAGADCVELLSYCRGPGPHVRGCWLLDLILGNP